MCGLFDVRNVYLGMPLWQHRQYYYNTGKLPKLIMVGNGLLVAWSPDSPLESLILMYLIKLVSCDRQGQVHQQCPDLVVSCHW